MKAQKRTKEAIESMNDYLKTFLNDFEAWLELANLYLSEQDYARAGHCMEEIILSQPLNHLYHQVQFWPGPYVHEFRKHVVGWVESVRTAA
ncbi:MAG: hypothetical protein GY696_06625 [Gammaproteobacteria bacterium]|nr:hypothetical protein [Gammaproteobacteria bacterium]